MTSHNLSHVWRTILTRLADYPLGVDQGLFCSIMGDGEHSYQATTKVALDQMFFNSVKYWETCGGDMIRITDAGRKALGE